MLAMAGEWTVSPAYGSDQVGFVVVFWQEAEDKLTPVAGYYLRREHSKIASIYLTH